MIRIKQGGLTPTQQLESLAALTKKTGAIHEAQALNLRLWPFSVDPELDRSQVQIDLGMPCEHQVAATHGAIGDDMVAIPTGATCQRCQHTVGHPLVTYLWRDAKRAEDWQPVGHYRVRLTELERTIKRALGVRFGLVVLMNGRQVFPFVSAAQSLGDDGRRARPRRRAGSKSKRVKRNTNHKAR